MSVKRSMMVRLFFVPILAIMVLIFSTKAFAEGNPAIVLDDATPTTDILITPTNGAAGAVFVELSGAQLRLTDSSNAPLINLADKRVSALGFELAAGANSYTLHLERLPGVASATVSVTAQDALPAAQVAASAASTAPVTTLNTPMITRVSLTSATSYPVIASQGADLLTMQFSTQKVDVQIADKSGVLLSSQAGTSLTSLSVKLDPGDYSLNLANRDAKSTGEVLLALSPAPAATLPQVVSNPATSSAPQTVANTDTSNVASCNATLKISSANLRSGPGTAYTIIGYALRDNVLPVGGVNKQGGWVLVQSPTSAAWLATRTAELSGSCDSLPTFDIPLLDGSPRPPSLSQPAENAAAPSGPAFQSSVPAAPAAPPPSGEDHSGENEND